MVHSADGASLKQSQSELNILLSEEALAGVPLAFVCNMQDLTRKASPELVSGPSTSLNLAAGIGDTQSSCPFVSFIHHTHIPPNARVQLRVVFKLDHIHDREWRLFGISAKWEMGIVDLHTWIQDTSQVGH
jgi:hypothetical protein